MSEGHRIGVLEDKAPAVAITTPSHPSIVKDRSTNDDCDTEATLAHVFPHACVHHSKIGIELGSSTIERYQVVGNMKEGFRIQEGSSSIAMVRLWSSYAMSEYH